MSAQGVLLRMCVVLDIVLAALDMSTGRYGLAVAMALIALVNLVIIEHTEAT